MNIPDLVDVLISYSKKKKPFSIDIHKKSNTILSLAITDNPKLKKWKKINTESFNMHKSSVKDCKQGVSFLSLSKKNQLVIPCLEAKHIQDFSLKYTRSDQIQFWKFVFKNAKDSSRIFTHGLDIGYLHIKIPV